MRTYSLSRGFTFIELIIVFTVLVIVGTIGIASLVEYTHSQEVVSTALDIKSQVQHTRSNTLAQIKPAACITDLSNPNNNSSLLGYEFDFCPGAALGRPAACGADSIDYEINAKCDNGIGYINILKKQYSTKLVISSTQRSYFFPVLYGGVDHTGTITVSGYGKSKVINITPLGVIE